MIGQTISHYKIFEKLGEGGMGVVYKAQDTKLDRDVALKFLPREVALSEEERARFIHEAKSVSALDHPNICTVYEINETPDGQMFIAMGYYEGKSISKMVEKGRLDVTEAVAIAIQIAEGLLAAHEKGIIHRDIKSSNIIVSDQGQVRILDFGLARKKGLSKLTKTGTTIGTAAYMSPEQAQGGKIDHRTDLWSLGVILYEMITGHLPFRGEHEAAILYSVVNEQPRPIEESISSASPELIHIINRALEKNPAERYKSAEDMVIDLRRLKKDTSRAGFAPVFGSRRRVSSLKNKLLISSGLIVLLCIAGYFYFVRPGVEINVNYSQRRIEVPYQNGIDAAISPDGKWIVFTAPDKNGKVDLYAMSSSGGTPRRLTNDSTQPFPLNGQSGYSYPRVSPDGSSVVYARYLKDRPPELCIVPLVGGQAVKIAEGASASWSPDGKRIGYVKSPSFSESKKGEFWTIRADGKENRLVFVDTVGFISADKGPVSITLESFLFDWSPDGDAIAWLRRLPHLHCEIVLHDLTTGTESRITPDTTIKKGLCWLRNNIILYSSSGEDGVHLRAIPHYGGTPVQITRGSGSETTPTASLDCSTILFSSTTATTDIGIGRLDGSDPVKVATIKELVSLGRTDPSPMNKQLVFSRQIVGLTSFTLSLINYDGTDERALTKGSDRSDIFPTWSPDGAWISFMSRRIYEPYASYKAYIINPKTMEESRLPFSGVGGEWLNDTTLLVANENNTKWFWAYLNGKPPIQIAADSIIPNFVDDGKYVLYKDLRKKAQANTWWIVPIARWSKDGGKDPEIFDWVGQQPPGWIYGGAIGRYRFTLWCDTSKGDLWKIYFPDKRKEQILRSCNQLKGIRSLQMSWDETEYGYARSAVVRQEINLIENLFK